MTKITILSQKQNNFIPGGRVMDEGWKKLCAAILSQAVEDYLMKSAVNVWVYVTLKDNSLFYSFFYRYTTELRIDIEKLSEENLDKLILKVKKKYKEELKRKEKEKLRKDAKKFLLSETCRFYCDMLDIDYEEFLKRLGLYASNDNRKACTRNAFNFKRSSASL